MSNGATTNLAYTQGHKVGYDGGAPASCPYADGSDDREHWMRGYTRGNEANPINAATAQPYQPKGVEFYDRASGRQMILIDDGEWDGWLCYKQEGQWVSLRRATTADREAIGRAGGGALADGTLKVVTTGLSTADEIAHGAEPVVPLYAEGELPVRRFKVEGLGEVRAGAPTPEVLRDASLPSNPPTPLEYTGRDALAWRQGFVEGYNSSTGVYNVSPYNDGSDADKAWLVGYHAGADAIKQLTGEQLAEVHPAHPGEPPPTARADAAVIAHTDAADWEVVENKGARINAKAFWEAVDKAYAASHTPVDVPIVCPKCSKVAAHLREDGVPRTTWSNGRVHMQLGAWMIRCPYCGAEFAWQGEPSSSASVGDDAALPKHVTPSATAQAFERAYGDGQQSPARIEAIKGVLRCELPAFGIGERAAQRIASLIDEAIAAMPFTPPPAVPSSGEGGGWQKDVIPQVRGWTPEEAGTKYDVNQIWRFLDAVRARTDVRMSSLPSYVAKAVDWTWPLIVGAITGGVVGAWVEYFMLTGGGH